MRQAVRPPMSELKLYYLNQWMVYVVNLLIYIKLSLVQYFRKLTMKH